MFSSNVCPCSLKTKYTTQKKFPKCTDILQQTMFFFVCFFYLLHITRWLILYILFKQKFSLPCAIQLECYFNLQFSFFVYLIKPNAARVYSRVLNHRFLTVMQEAADHPVCSWVCHRRIKASYKNIQHLSSAIVGTFEQISTFNHMYCT